MVRGQIATGSSSVFTAAFETTVNIRGSTWLLCVPKPLGDCTQSSTSKCSSSSGGSLHFIRPIHRTHPTSTQSLTPGTSTTHFPMGCQVLLLKPTWTRVCIPDFCSHCSYAGSKAAYSFALVGSTPTGFQENVPRPPIRAFMLLLEPKEGWHSVFTAHVALNSPVPWAEERQQWSQSPDYGLNFGNVQIFATFP